MSEKVVYTPKSGAFTWKDNYDENYYTSKQNKGGINDRTNKKPNR